MFEKLILRVIAMLKNITEELERAYNETYKSDNNLTQLFAQEVNKRKEENKKELIKKMTAFIIQKTLEDDNFLMPFEQAKLLANELFKFAKENGHINELNQYTLD